MSENKKLSELVEKITSLDADDLLYVSANGVSKSIKASTVEAPLKTYADNKASEAQAAAISAANSSMQSAVNAEAARAATAESALQNQITSEVSSRISADSTLQSNISQEAAYRIAADSALESAILQEVTDRQNAIYNAVTGSIIPRENLTFDLGSPEFRYKDLYLSGNSIILGETVISANEDGAINLQAGSTIDDELIASQNFVSSAINSEQSARESADNSLQQSISAEIARATAAEEFLSDRIDNIISNLDPEAVDSLTELLNAFQAADYDLFGTVTTITNSISNNLNTEIQNRQNAISNEENARIDGDSQTLQEAQSYTNAMVSTLIPPGAISMFAGSVAPDGYLLCDGSAVNRYTYSSLFSVIGTTYGSGNGTTTFNLPNPDSNSNIRLIIKI